MSSNFNPHLQAAILKAVESQIANDNPPERIKRINGHCAKAA